MEAAMRDKVAGVVTFLFVLVLYVLGILDAKTQWAANVQPTPTASCQEVKGE